MERLLVEWLSVAQTCLPAAAGMNELALRDGAAAMLQAVANDLKASQGTKDQREKCLELQEGERSSPLSETVPGYAAERLANGYTLDQLVSEYRALRASVRRLWSTSPGFPPRKRCRK